MQRLYPSSTRVVSVGHGFFHPSNPSNSFFSLFDSAKSNQISGNFLHRQIVTKKLRSTHTHTHSMGSGEWKEKTFKFHYNHRSSFIVYYYWIQFIPVFIICIKLSLLIDVSSDAVVIETHWFIAIMMIIINRFWWLIVYRFNRYRKIQWTSGRADWCWCAFFTS